jgi:hypothetical protein
MVYINATIKYLLVTFCFLVCFGIRQKKSNPLSWQPAHKGSIDLYFSVSEFGLSCKSSVDPQW